MFCREERDLGGLHCKFVILALFYPAFVTDSKLKCEHGMIISAAGRPCRVSLTFYRDVHRTATPLRSASEA